MKTEIVLRRGGAHDDVTVSNDEGTVTVDQSQFNRHQRITLRKMVVDTWKQTRR